jgi:nicotinamide mononucleotide adenylyltransferase
MFDWKKPTVQMLGRWQPWHDGHQALFKRCIAKTGQVAIQVRDVQGASGGDGQDDNPFNWDEVCQNIEAGLLKDGFKRGQEYEIMLGAKYCKYYLRSRCWIHIRRRSI